MRLRLIPFLLPGALFACGSVGDVGERAPLAVVEGQLTNQSAAAAPSGASAVRIAVLWVSVDGRAYKASQDVPATPVFPSKFRIELTDPPPAGAMTSKATAKAAEESAPQEEPQEEPPQAGPVPKPAPGAGGGAGGGSMGSARIRPADHDGPESWPADFALAVGTIVAYEDLNGNGKLDLVDKEATSYVDRVLGANEDLLLVYTEGKTFPPELVAPNGSKPVPGYNLLRIPRCVKAAPGTSGEGSTTTSACDGDEIDWLPITTLYDLPLTAEPRFATLMCKNDGVIFGGVSGGKWPAKDDPNVKCLPDGSGYFYTQCTTISQGLCKGTITECTTAGWSSPNSPPPAEWPCPVQ